MIARDPLRVAEQLSLAERSKKTDSWWMKVDPGQSAPGQPSCFSVTGSSGYSRRDTPGQGFQVLRHS